MTDPPEVEGAGFQISHVLGRDVGSSPPMLGLSWLICISAGAAPSGSPYNAYVCYRSYGRGGMILLPMFRDASSSSAMAAEKRPMSCFLVSLMRCTRMSSFSISER